MNEPISPSPDPLPGSNRKRNALLATGGAALLLIVCCCLLVAVILVVDPFQFNLMGRLFGGHDPIAGAMPPDTTFYMSVDLLKARSDKANRVIEAYSKSMGEPDIKDSSSLIEELDRAMWDETGLTFTDDILPWIGQYAGFGITDITFDRWGDPEMVDWYFAVESRNQKAADDFLLKLRDLIEDETREIITESTYKGVTIYEYDSGWDMDSAAFARSGSVVIFSASMSGVENAIDAQKGASLAKTSAYKSLMTQLSKDRLATVYLNGAQYQEFIEQLGRSSFGAMIDVGDSMGKGDMAMAFSFIDAGLQFDLAYAYDTATMTDAKKEQLKSVGVKPKTPQLLPEDAFFFVAGQRLDLVWSAYREVLESTVGARDFDEALSMFRMSFGINPDRDLFPYLDGEWSVSLIPSRDGLLAEEIDVPLGFILLLETSKPQDLTSSVQRFNRSVSGMGMDVNERKIGDLTVYALEESFMGTELIGFGINTKYLAISSSARTIDSLFTGGASLEKSKRYQEVMRAFPRNMSPSVYVDVDGLLGLFRSNLSGWDRAAFNEAVTFLDPISFIAGGTSSVKGNIVRSTAIIFLASP
jgi:hypothetical protein